MLLLLNEAIKPTARQKLGEVATGAGARGNSVPKCARWNRSTVAAECLRRFVHPYASYSYPIYIQGDCITDRDDALEHDTAPARTRSRCLMNAGRKPPAACKFC